MILDVAVAERARAPAAIREECHAGQKINWQAAKKHIPASVANRRKCSIQKWRLSQEEKLDVGRAFEYSPRPPLWQIISPAPGGAYVYYFEMQEGINSCLTERRWLSRVPPTPFRATPGVGERRFVLAASDLSEPPW